MSQNIEKKSRNVSSFWADDASRIETLKRLWAAGNSASEISRTFRGAVSRNAVIGKAARLGLPPHSSTVKQANQTRAAARSSSAPREASNLRSQAKAFGETRVPRLAPKPAPKLAVAGNGVVFEQAPPPAKPYLTKASVWAPLPGCQPVDVEDLKPRHCRWPIELSGEHAGYCGRDKAAGSSYCGVHLQISKPSARAKVWVDQRLGISSQVRAA
jgi:GcrA cell cycle regulator